MDLVPGCGRIGAKMSARGSRLPLLMALATLIGWLVLTTPDAEAQVFKPRGKTAATGKAAAAARKAAAPAATPSKKPARAGTTPRRAGNATPAKKAKTAGKARADDDDDVKIEDDDDDVKITDD
jgi:hypothetical protein